MFKLPICPHCSTIYRYGEVKNSVKDKTKTCYHCGKTFAVSKKGAVLLFVVLIAAASAINVLELYITPSLNFLVLAATNIILLIIGIVLIPFFVKFKKINGKADKNKNKK